MVVMSQYDFLKHFHLSVSEELLY